jgi:hypothetical protein
VIAFSTARLSQRSSSLKPTDLNNQGTADNQIPHRTTAESTDAAVRFPQMLEARPGAAVHEPYSQHGTQDLIDGMQCTYEVLARAVGVRIVSAGKPVPSPLTPRPSMFTVVIPQSTAAPSRETPCAACKETNTIDGKRSGQIIAEAAHGSESNACKIATNARN